MVGWAGAAVLLSTVDLTQTTNANGLAEVDVACNGGGADVEPVGGLGGELLEVTGLYGINPAGDGKLALALEESSIGFDELLGIDIANGNTRHDERSSLWC